MEGRARTAAIEQGAAMMEPKVAQPCPIATLSNLGTKMSIREFCRRNVICATTDTTVNEAASLMRRHHIGDVIITEQRGNKQIPVGIVTDRDIVIEVVAAGIDPRTLKLSDLKISALVTVNEGASYAETVARMSIDGVRRMPVVAGDGTLVGIITLDDMLWQLAAPLAALAALSTRGRELETTTRG
jgi:CBS domain-containing protein